MKVSLFAALSIMVICSSLHAADYYVSPGGNDGNDGSKDKPFATMVRARDAVRAKIAEGMDADVVVEIAPGSYFNSEPIRLDERDSGRGGHFVIYRGASPEGVKIYGGEPATQWEKYKDNIWRAPIAKNKPLYQLIVDDKPAVMARFPKFGDGYSTSWCEGGKVPDAWRKWDYSDAQIIGFLQPNWFGDTARIYSVDPATGKIHSGGGSGYFGGMGARRYVRGLLGLLTEPGEWCPQRKEGYVYYWPATGEPGDHTIVVPLMKRLLDVRGSAMDKVAENIKFESLELIGTDSFELLGMPAEGIQSDENVEGLVRIENARNIVVSKCKIIGSGWIGVAMQHWAQSCEVSNCLINHSGFDGVFANGFNPGAPPFTNAKDANVNFGHRIYNNAILNSGEQMGHGSAVQFWQSGHDTIENNYIRRAPRYGVSHNSWPWNKGDKVYGIEVTDQNQYQFRYTSNMVVGYNDIGLVCRDSSDFGAIQGWWPGRDIVWEYNAIHDVHADVDWDGWAHGAHPDDGFDYFTIRGCIFYFLQGGNATGGWMLKGQHQTTDNNVIADSRMNRDVTAEPYGRPAFDITNTHNIFDAEVKNYYTGGGRDMAKLFDFNVFWPRLDNQLQSYRSWGAEEHSVCADPQFVLKNPPWDRTWRDYDVKETSPALKLGFQHIPMDKIGLRTSEFPFDLAAAERRDARQKIQAEDNDRIYHARNQGSTYVYHVEPGAWLKFEDIDFGTTTPTKITANVDYFRGAKRYGGEITASPLREQPSEQWSVIDRWEISPSYKIPGKKAQQLFDAPFDPETNPGKVQWKPFLKPTISKSGVVSPLGVADLDIINGEGQENSCAYLRCSINVQKATDQIPLDVDGASGIKVWLNGKQVIAENTPGHKVANVALAQGWNTLLVKVNQNDARYKPVMQGLGNFWCKVGFEQTEKLGLVSTVPGLPLEEKQGDAPDAAAVAMEVRIDSVQGKVIGAFKPGQTEINAATVTGVHNVYLVFPTESVNSVNWFRFE